MERYLFSATLSSNTCWPFFPFFLDARPTLSGDLPLQTRGSQNWSRGSSPAYHSPSDSFS